MNIRLIGLAMLAIMVVGAASMFLIGRSLTERDYDAVMLWAAVLNAFSTLVLAAAVVVEGERVVNIVKGNKDDDDEDA